MSRTLAKLLCLAALSALAIPAYAQTDTKSTGQVAQGTTPPASTAPASPSGNAMSPEEKAAKAACDSKTGAEKDKCLKDVEAKYDKSSTNKMTAPSEAPKTGSTK